jgi:sugar/nucleoside kinase (ribokinase family)
VAGPNIRNSPVLVPGFPVRAVDTNGAGDTHGGVLAAALSRGDDVLDAARRANAAAAIAVTRWGPATAPTAAEIDAMLAG